MAYPSIGAAAPALGISARTLSSYERGESVPDTVFLAKLAEATGANFASMVRAGLTDAGIEGIEVVAAPAAGSPADQESGGVVLVPVYEVSAAAGAGALVEREDVETEIAFRADWLRGVLGVPARRLAVIRAVGNSMEPMLMAGDSLLVELEPPALIEGAVYVIARDGELMVKRTQRLPDGGLVLHSDNPAYGPVEFLPGQAQELRVIGRVRWIGRVL